MGGQSPGPSCTNPGYPFSVLDTGVRSAQSVVNASGLATQSWPIISADSVTRAAPRRTYLAIRRPVRHLRKPTRSRQHPAQFFPRAQLLRYRPEHQQDFTFRERYKFEIGAFFFNVLNHPNFDCPSTTWHRNFGKILETVSAPTSAYGSFQGSAVSGRVIQTQVKFTF